MNDGYVLSRHLDAVTIKSKTEDRFVKSQIDIAGKKFPKLGENVKELLLASELQIYEFTDCTVKVVRKIYIRQNAAKALNNIQLRSAIETDEMSELIYSLKTYPIFEKVLTPAQRKKDLENIETLKTSMDKLNEAYAELKINKVSLPMNLYSSYRVVEDKKSSGKRTEKILTFIVGIDAKDEYKLYIWYYMVKERLDYCRNQSKAV